MVLMAHGDTSYDDLGSGSSVPRKLTVTALASGAPIGTRGRLYGEINSKINPQNFALRSDKFGVQVGCDFRLLDFPDILGFRYFWF